MFMKKIADAKDNRVNLLFDFNYYLKGGFWLAISQVGAFALGFLNTYFFTNYASKEVYGAYGYTLSIIGILSLISLPGVNNAIMYSSAKGFDGVLLRGTKIRLKYAILGAVILIIISFYFSIFSDKKMVGWGLLFSAILFPFAFSTNGYLSFLQGKKAFKEFSLLSVSSTLLTTSAVIFGIFFLKKVSLILLSRFLAISLANLFFLRYTLNRCENSNIDNNFLKLSRNMSLLGILGGICSNIDRVFVGTVLSLSTMALYNFSFVLTNPLRTVGVFINKLAFPKMAMGKRISVMEKLKKLVPFLLGGIILTGILAYFVIPYIVRLLFPKYMKAVPFLRIMTFSGLLAIPSLLIISFLYAFKELHKIFYVLHIGAYLGDIGLLIILGTIFGVYGVIWGRLISRSLTTLIDMVILFNTNKMLIYGSQNQNE